MSDLISCKVVLIGGSNVGKTTMITSFITGKFTDVVGTVQASCVKKRVDVRGVPVLLEIWDTAGQERYRAVGPMFFRNALACIAVYDGSELSTSGDVDRYIEDYRQCFEEGSCVVIAANKIDLVTGDLEDALAVGHEAANRRGCAFFSTSAKTGYGITELFDHVAIQAAQRKAQSSAPKMMKLENGGGQVDSCQC